MSCARSFSRVIGVPSAVRDRGREGRAVLDEVPVRRSADSQGAALIQRRA
jgi:hypothetical protein